MILAAAACAALAVFVLMRPPVAPRLHRVLAQHHRLPEFPAPKKNQGLSQQTMLLLSIGAAVLVFLLMGGVWGAALGIGVFFGIRIAVTRFAGKDDVARNIQLQRQAPVIAELLAAIMEAGAPIRDGVGAVATAVPEPARSELLTVHRLMEMGASADQAWAACNPALAPIAQALRRSEESGAAVGQVLSSTALDMRRNVRAEVESAARAAGVRVVAPLALCFLPAYLLIGVVPVIASLAAELTIGWGG